MSGIWHKWPDEKPTEADFYWTHDGYGGVMMLWYLPQYAEWVANDEYEGTDGAIRPYHIMHWVEIKRPEPPKQ